MYQNETAANRILVDAMKFTLLCNNEGKDASPSPARVVAALLALGRQHTHLVTLTQLTIIS